MTEKFSAMFCPVVSETGHNIAFSYPLRRPALVNNYDFRCVSKNEAMRRRLALLPEDRKRAGLVLGMSIMDNVSLAHIDHFSQMGFIDRGRELTEVEKLTKRLRVKAPVARTRRQLPHQTAYSLLTR